jgi:hypothetical protein
LAVADKTSDGLSRLGVRFTPFERAARARLGLTPALMTTLDDRPGRAQFPQLAMRLINVCPRVVGLDPLALTVRCGGELQAIPLQTCGQLNPGVGATVASGEKALSLSERAADLHARCVDLARGFCVGFSPSLMLRRLGQPQ